MTILILKRRKLERGVQHFLKVVQVKKADSRYLPLERIEAACVCVRLQEGNNHSFKKHMKK